MLALSSSAFAQSERGFVRGLGGVSFGTETSSVFGAGAGFNVGPNIQITFEVGRFQNVLPREIKDQLDLLASLLTAEFGLPVTIDVKLPAVYGTAGLRWNFPATAPHEAVCRR